MCEGMTLIWFVTAVIETLFSLILIPFNSIHKGIAQMLKDSMISRRGSEK
jgi:hypothetical protein